MPTPTILPIGMDLTNGLAQMEATDAEIGQSHESIDVGPLPDGSYVRLLAPDLVVRVDEARRLFDRIEEAVLDARHDKMMAERHVCPGCPTMLDPEEITCGAPACNRELAMDGGFR